MLDEQDIRLLKEMFAEYGAGLEARMEAMMDEKLSASESRMETMMDQKIHDSERRMMVFYENAIQPQFRLLAEGQQALREQMVPAVRVEALKEDVAVLKAVVHRHAEELQSLQPAQ